MVPLDIPLSSVSLFTQYAVSTASKYLELMEAQISQAHADMRFAAREEYRRIVDPDETDYDNYVGVVDRRFEEDFRPIFRFAQVVYLYMVFETYTLRHVTEIQELRHDKPDILKKLKRQKNGRGLVEAARIYFRDHVRWKLLDRDTWTALAEVAELRNCIIHSRGVARDSKHPELIDRLERRKWRGQAVGIQIDRYKGQDVGQPIIVHQRFLEYFLYLVDKYFTAVIEATHATFCSKKGT